MSGIFQGYTNSNGRVRASEVTKVPAGSANDRGMIVAGNRVIPYLRDGGQPRTLHDGIAFDTVTGLLLAAEAPFGPTNISMGGLLVDSRGAVMLTNGNPQVIHQGVGLQNNGRLSIESEPIATFIAHLRNNVASTTGPGTFTRASDGLYQGADGVWRVAGSNEPRFEDSQLLMEPASTNKCGNYNAVIDAALKNISTGGTGTLSRQDDSVALEAAGLTDIGNGFAVDVLSGGTVFNANIAGASNAATHTISAWVRKIGTTGFVNFRSSGLSLSVPVDSEQYQRYEVSGLLEASEVLQVATSGGGHARFVLNQMEELPVPTSPIITQGAAASRAIDALTYANADQFFNQAQGMALITMRPRFDKGQNSGVEGLLTVNSASRANVLYYDTAFRSNDGTNVAAVATPAFVKGDLMRVAATWGPAGPGALNVGYRLNDNPWVWSVAAAYDGAYLTDDILAIVATCGIPVQVSDVRLYDENRGEAWIEANYP